ncbi:MAG: hypothetical protein WBQ82_02245 [Methyloceanibacter sp.]
MTSSNPPNFARLLVLIAGICLLAAPQGALAKHKDHSDDHGEMSSNDSSDDHGDKHSEDHKDKNKDHAEKDMKSDKHKGKHKDKEYAEDGMNSDKHKGKHKDKESADKDKTTDTASTADSNTPPATDGGGLLVDHGIVGRKPTDITPIDQGSVSGPGAVNTIHPIASPPPPAPVTGSNAIGNGIGGAFGAVAGALKPTTGGLNTSTSTQQSGNANGNGIGGAFGALAGALKPVTAGPNTSTSTQQSGNPVGSGIVGAIGAAAGALKPVTAGPNTSTSTQQSGNGVGNAADGGMSSNDSNDDHGDEHSDDHKDKESAENGMNSDKHKGKHKDKESADNGMNSDKHKGKHKDKESAEKDTEQDKSTDTASTANGNAPTADDGGLLVDHGFVGQTPIDIKPIPSPAPGTVSGPGAGATNAVRAVTISNGKGGSFQIPDHGAGVTVTSGGPGKLTISNGVQTQTVSGIAWTISGASTVAVSKDLGVGHPDTPGSVVVLSPNGTVTGGPAGGSVVGAILDTLNPPYEAHRVDETSTIQQQ